MFKNAKDMIGKTQDFFRKQQYKARKKFFDMVMDTKKLDGRNKLTLGFFMNLFGAELHAQEKLDPIVLKTEFLQDILINAELSQLIYDDISIRQFPEGIDSVFYEKSEEKPGIVPFFLADSEKHDTIFVVCRGTFCFADVITDLKAKSVEFDDGLIHEGILKSSIYVIENSSFEIHSHIMKHPTRKVVFTGHSLGAGTAAIASMIFKDQNPTITTTAIVFAPPPTITHKIWEKTLEVISITLADDPVPFSSLYNAAMASSSVLPNAIAKKFIETFEEEKLVPPGKQYHISINNLNPLETQIEEVPSPQYYLHLPSNLNEAHHSMPLYIKSIEKLIIS